MSIDYPAILIANYPDAQWTLNGDTYDGLTWLSDTPKPTQAELDAAWPQVNSNKQLRAVKTARQIAYTQIADPLFFKWQRGDATEQEWLDAIQAVKDANPYN